MSDAETLRWCREVVSRVAAFEPEMNALPDDGLRSLTASFRGRLATGEPVADLLPEAFAAVREAAIRTLGQRPFDVQVMGGAVLHLGKIAEMRTGEGKTLTATMPVYLHALTGTGVHVITANDYLARRDAEWMGPLYRFLGLSVSLLEPPQRPEPAARRVEYGADVTYGGWQQFGYDYLRDNLAWKPDGVVQRGHHFAVVDEADMILIDEMRISLMINGPVKDAESRHPEFAAVAARLERGRDYETDERARTVSLSESGDDVVQSHFGVGNLYQEENLPLVHYVQNAVRAKELFQRDRDYIVSGGQVLVIDQTSGRPLPGRRYDEGIHEAIEAKEGLEVRAETQLLAAGPVWDYLGQYRLLAGMTGTAQDDAETYRQVYQFEVVTIPTNKPMIRVDHLDAIYRTRQSKLVALADETATRHATGQPILIGATSIEQSGIISGMLTERGVGHEVLTALNHQAEAQIIAGAARVGAVTVVAKMAGRGVDIVLGGADQGERDQAAELGGLCVLGAERPVKRRLEMHMRGRAGRQGDPGEAKFFVSYEDELVKAALGEKQAAFWTRHGPDGPFARLSAGLTSGQARLAANEATWLVSNREFDRVLTDQQHLIYAERAPAARGQDVSGQVRRLIEEVGGQDAHIAYDRREAELGSTFIRELERRVILSCLERGWREHAQAMPELLKSITLRASGDTALAEYRREGTLSFNRMRAGVNEEIVRTLFHIKASPSDLNQSG